MAKLNVAATNAASIAKKKQVFAAGAANTELQVRPAEKSSSNKGTFSTSVLFITLNGDKIYLGKIFGSKQNSPAKLDYMLDLIKNEKVELLIQEHETLSPDGELKQLMDAFHEPGEDIPEEGDFVPEINNDEEEEE